MHTSKNNTQLRIIIIMRCDCLSVCCNIFHFSFNLRTTVHGSQTLTICINMICLITKVTVCREAPKIVFTCSILLFVRLGGQIKQWGGVAPARKSICLFVVGKINCRSNRLQRYKHSRKAHKSRWPSQVLRLPCMGTKVINTKIRPLAVAPEKDRHQQKMNSSHWGFIL